MKSKICGISDSKTLKYLTEHPNPPQYIGFIVNYPKSKRFVEHNHLKELLKISKKNPKYVAVLVKPDENILEEIKDLSFDYYQVYDCTPAKNSMVRVEGIEPPLPDGNQILSLTRLPIPPHPHLRRA